MRTSELLKRPGVAYAAGYSAAYARGSEPDCAAIAAGFCTPLVAVVPANEVPLGTEKPARGVTRVPANVEPRYS